MADQAAVVEVDLRVECQQFAIAGNDQRVDFGQAAVELTNRRQRDRMKWSAARNGVPVSPRRTASLRAWKLARPVSGWNGSRKISSGVSAATCSILTPPSLRNHQHGPLCGPVDGHTQVEFAGDVAAGLHQHAADRLPFGAGLHSHQRLAQQIPGDRRRLLGTPHKLDAMLLGCVFTVPLPRPPAWIWALTTATSPANSRCASAASPAVVDHDARWHRHAPIAKDLLGLVFVDLHRRTVDRSARTWPTHRSPEYRLANGGRSTSADLTSPGIVALITGRGVQRESIVQKKTPASQRLREAGVGWTTAAEVALVSSLLQQNPVGRIASAVYSKRPASINR